MIWIGLKNKKRKKIRPIIRDWFDQLIKQSVMRKKPKVIRDKLKDKIINDIWRVCFIKFTTYSDANEVIKKLFNSLRSKYQDGFETSTKGSDYIFYSGQLMYCKCHKVNFKRGCS